MNKRKQKAEAEEQQFPVDPIQRSNNRVALRLLLMAYLAYLIYQLIRGYLAEGTPFLLVSAIVFAVAEVVIVVSSIRRWMREQAAAFAPVDSDEEDDLGEE